MGPPAASTINRAWLGKQGRGRVFIAQPASLCQKQPESTLCGYQPSSPAWLGDGGFHSWNQHSFGAHHSSFHALSPKALEEEFFCRQLQKGARCKSSSASITHVHSSHRCIPALMPFTPSLCCSNACPLSECNR